jgi:SSS family solute:Na+ symporter
MAICFGLCLVAMTIITIVKPLPQPIEFHTKTDLNLTASGGAKLAGVVVIIIVLALYVLFSPIGLAR